MTDRRGMSLRCNDRSVFLATTDIVSRGSLYFICVSISLAPYRRRFLFLFTPFFVC